ncbi:hypothetical protein K449DRAFT_390640 [Hypoxylon sp. EC38]|nr:hypothetical protein K449DRAFT_390640 [Hypoxylon sp. EC38]
MTTTPANNPTNVLARAARKIYRAVGFSKWYNFWLWLILGGGGFLYFSVARLKYLDFYGAFCGGSSGQGERDLASPGECFYYLMPGRYQLGIIIHLACVLPASILACVQFIPVVRRKAMRLHRVNGWVSTVLAIIGSIGTMVISPRSMGGGVDTISMVTTQGILFITSLVIGCIHAKRHNIAKHRVWMLRAWVIGGAIITMRYIMGITMVLASLNGGYYYAEPCDKINFILGSQNETIASYPECASFFSGEDPSRHVAVHATIFTKDKVKIAASINMVFGTAGWVAIVVHAALVELYLHYESAGRNTKKPGQAGVSANTAAVKVD